MTNVFGAGECSGQTFPEQWWGKIEGTDADVSGDRSELFSETTSSVVVLICCWKSKQLMTQVSTSPKVRRLDLGWMLLVLRA